jgi:calcineurin-like phosphoesterase family protein
MRLLAPVVAVLIGLVLASRPYAQGSTCEFDNVERVVAVGDVHGAYDRFVEILLAAGLIDKRTRWTGGKTHLVQLGDVVDRGPDSRKALDLLRKLEREASGDGGRVHALIGNHEAMRLMNDMRYVVPGEYAAFTDGGSAELRRAFIENSPKEQREALEKELVPGMIEMIRAFGPKGEYGMRLRTLNAVVRINGVVFLHGGISPAVAAMPCAAINETVRRELSVDLEKTRAAPNESLTAREDGPLWYRGLAQEPETFEPQLTEILTAQKARAIVVAHTVASTGRITARFAGKVFMIDTGMQPAYVEKGRASALEIKGEVFTAIYRDSREVVGGGQPITAR